MLVTEIVEVKWSNRNKDWFISKGYEFTKLKDVFKVKTMDLTIGSHQKIECTCDYCGKTLTMEFRQYLKQVNRSIIKEDCCTNCGAIKKEKQTMIKYGVKNTTQLESTQKKMRETNSERYGVEYYSQTDEFNEKVRNTTIEKYGVEHYSQTDEFKIKVNATMRDRYGKEWYTQTDEYKVRVEETNVKKYGVPYPMQNEEVKQKGIDTNIKRYGVRNVFQSEEVKDIIKQFFIDNFGVEHNSQTDEFREAMKENWNNWKEDGTIDSILEKRVSTNMKVYGVPYPMQNPEVAIKTFTTMYKNGTAPCSKQQKLIHKLVGGELNMPVGNCILDISFPEDKIYLEYDGGGHDLSVQLGNISQEEFDKKERRRGFYLKNNGWKEIRIITNDDKLPSDNAIIKFIKSAKSILKDDLGFSVRWNLNMNNVSLNYTHTYTLDEFFDKFNKKEAI